ncbi:hypothetical protein [Falsihalocynthiibacter sp. CO-5D18]|uniref:hypothetical protein n=1 Tax=Falsihalocynthiibacter sp. CO-5D18 TaxID=3240872 RepID=UPI003510BB8E
MDEHDPVISAFLIANGLLTEAQVAAIELVEISTIRSRRARSQMPMHFKAGNNVLYDAKDIAARILATKMATRRRKPVPTAANDLLSSGAK